METELLLNELFKIQKRLDSLEEENKKLYKDLHDPKNS